MKILVGLGNPEEKYSGTRHNLGFEVVDEFRRKLNLGDWGYERQFKSETLKFSYSLSPKPLTLILVKPRTYMNLSGLAVVSLVRFYRVAPEDIIIVHDELDLPLGKIKVRLGGAAAGHHGVESVINELGSDQFIRVRLGIGNLKSHSGEHKRISFSAEKFVLEPFLQSEHSEVKHMVKKALGAIELILDKGLETAKNQFN